MVHYDLVSEEKKMLFFVIILTYQKKDLKDAGKVQFFFSDVDECA